MVTRNASAPPAVGGGYRRLEPIPKAEEPQLPLWLTEDEATAVLLMIAVAPSAASASVEHAVFNKLGRLLRSFNGHEGDGPLGL